MTPACFASIHLGTRLQRLSVALEGLWLGGCKAPAPGPSFRWAPSVGGVAWPPVENDWPAEVNVAPKEHQDWSAGSPWKSWGSEHWVLSHN